jgi:hypothetical protein
MSAPAREHVVDFLAEPGEVGGKNAGGDPEGSGHGELPESGCGDSTGGARRDSGIVMLVIRRGARHAIAVPTRRLLRRDVRAGGRRRPAVEQRALGEPDHLIVGGGAVRRATKARSAATDCARIRIVRFLGARTPVNRHSCPGSRLPRQHRRLAWYADAHGRGGCGSRIGHAGAGGADSAGQAPEP